MNISLNWLRKYLELDMPVEEISGILTTIGLEVEGISEVESIRGGLKGIKIGHVLTADKHPDADKLKVTTVDLGEGESIQVVCGAPNVAAGQKVLVATVGAMLYNAEEPWKIKKGKIRGQVSEGMICAEDELGLGNSHDGILVLTDDAVVGRDAADHFELQSDIVFDIGLTPNRSDATSHLGVARDLYAYLKVNKDYDGELKEPDTSAFSVEHESYPIEVEVKDRVACPRFSGITLSNVEVKESPKWIKDLLNSIGIRPINNVVDITNYVLHELGQPLHAFDADEIDGRKIVVTTLDEGTKFTTLDDYERTLSASDLMICNSKEEPMSIAGVFGGIHSGVTDNTKNIFLESAHFNANTIRKTSTKHLLRTEAAKIFEKGSDPNVTIYALKRAANLLVEYAGAKIASEIVDVYPENIKPAEINVKYKNISGIIGTPITNDEVHNILRAMDMELSPIDEGTLKVKVPTNKADVTREIDIIEEILRIYGLNAIPVPSKITSTLHFIEHPTKRSIKENISNYLSANGYNEIMGLSLIESRHYDKNQLVNDENRVFINNTSNIHLDIMRPEMLLSGLTSVAHNLNRQQNNLKLYEFGKSYQVVEKKYVEREYLTIFITGNNKEQSWREGIITEADFYEIKRSVLMVLDKAGITGYQVSEIEESDMFTYGVKYHRGPSVLAEFGEVEKSLTTEMGIKSKIYFAQIPVKALVKSAKKVDIKISEISKFPTSRRDLALVVDKRIKFSEIEKLGYATDKKILNDIRLFDIYNNEEALGEGKKSYAVSYHFEDASKTLKDKDIDKVMSKMIETYESKLGATIRK